MEKGLEEEQTRLVELRRLLKEEFGQDMGLRSRKTKR